ncbi:ExeA family protein [Aromatoleum evansii]|uniref:ExeA family protein n=1 Tax=Aromatoleum evansii TaxID=59406 RepID=UPI001B7D13A2|nr:AAA family ATPase [Aromatoleum evansii]
MKAPKDAPAADSPEPMPIKLKAVLLRHGIRQDELADCLPQSGTGYAGRKTLSRAAVVRMLNNGWRPAKTPWADIQKATEEFLVARGVPPEQLAEIWDEDVVIHHSIKPLGTRIGETRSPKPEQNDTIDIGTEMLSAQAKRHFSLFRDPFVDDVQGPEDLFLSADQRYVREAMYQAAKTGGWFIAVVGESGSGKTTLRRETIDRIGREGLPVAVVQPKSFDKTALKSAHICQAILADVKPNEHAKRSLEALARQVERALVESGRSGQSHVLIIEEAHDLSIQTLKYLKRFWEMEDGFKKLLSIVLIGQPELKEKLNERQYFEAREVIRRCEVVELLPLDNQVGDYLALKFKRHGRSTTEILDESAFDAIRARLTLVGRGPQRNATVSMTYPLVVNNLVTKAMNLAAELGAAKVTADIVKGC